MNILFSIAAYFPYGTPYASRARNICRILRDLGHNVVIFCDYVSTEAKEISIGVSEHEGIEIHYSTSKRTIVSKSLKAFKSVRNIKEYIKQNKVDLIISNQSSDRFIRVYKLAKEKKIPIVVDLCEKYHFSNWKLGRFDFRYYEFLKCWDRYYCKVDGFIVISNYLMNCFDTLGKPIAKIPTIVDSIEFLPFFNMRDYSFDIKKFVFTGGLGHGKDKVIEWLSVIQNDDKRVEKYQVNIFGPSYKDIDEQKVKMNSSVLLDDPCFVIHGRIPQKEVPKNIAKNSFGLILRPNRESSNAGFPTKIAEYLAVGTPVISNTTSDIPNYIIDGKNGFIVQDLNEKTLRALLDRIDAMDIDDYKRMCQEARNSAVDSFDYRNYIEIVDQLINSVVDEK